VEDRGQKNMALGNEERCSRLGLKSVLQGSNRNKRGRHARSGHPQGGKGDSLYINLAHTVGTVRFQMVAQAPACACRIFRMSAAGERRLCKTLDCDTLCCNARAVEGLVQRKMRGGKTRPSMSVRHVASLTRHMLGLALPILCPCLMVTSEGVTGP
jgi:hypothetical protein